MRLYRGKRKDNGEWVKGFLICDTEFYGTPDPHTYIINHNHPSGCFGGDIYIEVVPETVGQSIDRFDDNGVEIFEGDWLRVKYREYPSLEEFCEVSEVSYNKEESCYYPLRWDETCECCDYEIEFISLEVVGNIHDNPQYPEEE